MIVFIGVRSHCVVSWNVYLMVSVGSHPNKGCCESWSGLFSDTLMGLFIGQSIFGSFLGECIIIHSSSVFFISDRLGYNDTVIIIRYGNNCIVHA